MQMTKGGLDISHGLPDEVRKYDHLLTSAQYNRICEWMAGNPQPTKAAVSAMIEIFGGRCEFISGNHPRTKVVLCPGYQDWQIEIVRGLIARITPVGSDIRVLREMPATEPSNLAKWALRIRYAIEATICLACGFAGVYFMDRLLSFWVSQGKIVQVKDYLGLMFTGAVCGLIAYFVGYVMLVSVA